MCNNCIRNYPRGDRPLPIRVYVDDRGYKYKVRAGIGSDCFKGFSQDNKHNGEFGWKGMRQLPWESTFDEAQAVLDGYASGKGWQEQIEQNNNQ